MDTTSLPTTAGLGAEDLRKADELKSKTADGAGPAVSHLLPKPVEVVSVPQTPINGGTPAGQSPRPELNTAPEPTSNKEEQEQAARDAAVFDPPTSVPEDASALSTVTDEPVHLNGSDKPVAVAGSLPTTEIAEPPAVPATGEKRKFDDQANTQSNGASSQSGQNGKELAHDAEAREDKRARVEDAPAEEKKGLNGVGINAPKKAGRPKKANQVAAPVMPGRTTRKTRSQGPVDEGN